MNDDGTMNELAGEFAGMDRFEARKATVAKLQELGALVEIETVCILLDTLSVQVW